MFDAPQAYRDALADDIVRIDVYIAIGSNIDPTAADDITAVTGPFLPMSNPAQITDANYQMTEWMATFEGDGIKTSADRGNLAPPIQARPYPPQVGLWSEGISDGQGNIDFGFSITLKAPHTSALTIFTYDTDILAGTVSYYLNGATQGVYDLKAAQRRASVGDAVTYDRIDVHISKLDRPYNHVKIAEIEFGSSITYSKTRLTGNVTLIKEWDPLMQSIPLHELDFSIINVLGEFDPDNPNGLYQTIRQDYPVELSFSLTAADGSKYTIPCGRFMIAERKATDTTLDVVALDARSALSNNLGGLTLSTGQSFGDVFTDLFKGLNIPFTVDEALFTEYPDQNMTFNGDDYDLLTIMRHIEQYYDIWLVPERSGSIRATKSVPRDDYGTVPPSMVIQYPKSDVGRTFNYISIAYGDSSGRKNYVLDLRTDPAQLRAQIAIINPLVKTLEKAKALAEKVRTAMYSEKLVTEWRGDPALDITDTLAIGGKWDQGNPPRTRALYSELTYNGGISERTTTYH